MEKGALRVSPFYVPMMMGSGTQLRGFNKGSAFDYKVLKHKAAPVRKDAFVMELVIDNVKNGEAPDKVIASWGIKHPDDMALVWEASRQKPE